MVRHQGKMTLLCDEMSAISISKNPIHHSRTNHILTKHCFIRELVEDEHVHTAKHIIAIVTKAIGHSVYEALRLDLGLCVLEA